MRTKTGTVSSTKMPKTIVVTVHTYKRHPKYFKSYRTTKKFYAHDENEVCVEGDEVTIRESRPLSKLKRWTVHEVNGKPAEGLKPAENRNAEKIELKEEPEVNAPKEAPETPEAPEETPEETA